MTGVDSSVEGSTTVLRGAFFAGGAFLTDVFLALSGTGVSGDGDDGALGVGGSEGWKIPDIGEFRVLVIAVSPMDL